jgi:hypothetical protein
MTAVNCAMAAELRDRYVIERKGFAHAENVEAADAARYFLMNAASAAQAVLHAILV